MEQFHNRNPKHVEVLVDIPWIKCIRNRLYGNCFFFVTYPLIIVTPKFVPYAEGVSFHWPASLQICNFGDTQRLLCLSAFATSILLCSYSGLLILLFIIFLWLVGLLSHIYFSVAGWQLNLSSWRDKDMIFIWYDRAISEH